MNDRVKKVAKTIVNMLENDNRENVVVINDSLFFVRFKTNSVTGEKLLFISYNPAYPTYMTWIKFQNGWRGYPPGEFSPSYSVENIVDDVAKFISFLPVEAQEKLEKLVLEAAWGE